VKTTTRERDTAQPGHLAPARTDHVHADSHFLQGVDVRVITGGGDGGARAADDTRTLKQTLCELVKRHGGTHSEAQHAGVTHVVCDPSAVDGVAFNAAKRSGLDVLTPGWLHDCVEHARVLTPRPKHRLHLSRSTVERSEGRIDAFGDDHLVDVDLEDLVQLVRGDRVVNAARNASIDADVVSLEREMAAVSDGKIGDDDERDESMAWRAFRGCVVSFIGSPTSGGGDGAEDEIVHSLGLSVRARGGTLCDAPTRDGCTHVVLMDGVDATVVETVLPASARVVTARWLRETLETGTVACA
jgi:hypothetical protein